jgi:uroporphyrinogen-III synthase
VVVATNGIGIRSWFGAAESWGADRALVAALDGARRIARGPKARAALAAVGLPSHADEPSERLDPQVEALVAIDRLGTAGADVVPVPIYRWQPPDDLDPARRLLKELLVGQLDAVTFTSSAAVRTLAELADGAGVGEGLRAALSSTVLTACIGPVTAEAAAAAGFERRCVPDRGRLGLMVRALADALHCRHRHLAVGGREVVVHGASVWAGDASVLLTDLERNLFALLAERPHAVVSRTTLRQRIWGPRSQESAIDSAVSRLRKVLRPVGCGVDTVQRRGWTLAASELPCPHDPADALIR